MKNRILNLFLIAVLILSLAGCSLWAAEEGLDAAEDVLEYHLDKAGNALWNRNSDRNSMLTQEEATSIALAHAGFAADDVRQLSAYFEMDDGVPEFNVRFRDDRWEYEYEIHAETGTILSADRDD